ncbi:hypothetical protein M514_03113, partial [Trichuris suis]
MTSPPTRILPGWALLTGSSQKASACLKVESGMTKHERFIACPQFFSLLRNASYNAYETFNRQGEHLKDTDEWHLVSSGRSDKVQQNSRKRISEFVTIRYSRPEHYQCNDQTNHEVTPSAMMTTKINYAETSVCTDNLR